jgi:hypothetical protein
MLMNNSDFTVVIIYLFHQLIRSEHSWAHLCTRNSRQHIISMPFRLYFCSNLTGNIFSQNSEVCLKCGQIGEMKYLRHRALTYQTPSLSPCHVGRAYVTRSRSKTQTDGSCNITLSGTELCCFKLQNTVFHWTKHGMLVSWGAILDFISY